MKKAIVLMAVFLLGIFTVLPANALEVTIYDNYIGSEDHGWGDVIGDPADFDVKSMDVSIAGGILSVGIKTNYYNQDPFKLGMTKGAFFISLDGWDPYGTSPYYNDDVSNGEPWELALDLENDSLYKITAANQAQYDDSIILSEEAMTAAGAGNYIYRNGQEVGINADSDYVHVLATILHDYDSITKTLSFTIDMASLGLDWSNLGFHYASAFCGNDVIEGAAPVPEPATMMLMGIGLLGLGIVNRRKMKK